MASPLVKRQPIANLQLAVNLGYVYQIDCNFAIVKIAEAAKHEVTMKNDEKGQEPKKTKTTRATMTIMVTGTR